MNASKLKKLGSIPSINERKGDPCIYFVAADDNDMATHFLKQNVGFTTNPEGAEGAMKEQRYNSKCAAGAWGVFHSWSDNRIPQLGDKDLHKLFKRDGHFPTSETDGDHNTEQFEFKKKQKHMSKNEVVEYIEKCMMEAWDFIPGKPEEVAPIEKLQSYNPEGIRGTISQEFKEKLTNVKKLPKVPNRIGLEMAALHISLPTGTGKNAMNIHAMLNECTTSGEHSNIVWVCSMPSALKEVCKEVKKWHDSNCYVRVVERSGTEVNVIHEPALHAKMTIMLVSLPGAKYDPNNVKGMSSEEIEESYTETYSHSNTFKYIINGVKKFGTIGYIILDESHHAYDTEKTRKFFDQLNKNL